MILKRSTLLMMGFTAMFSVAFAQKYSLITSMNNPYTPLANPTTILTNWDTSLFIDQDLGLTNFKFADMTFNFDGSYPNGAIMFGAGIIAGRASSDSIDLDFDGFFADLKSSEDKASPSAMNFEVTGNAPNRILKLEWKNAKLNYGDAGDYVNFQMWLYESTSKCEVHFGPSNIKNPAVDFGPGQDGPFIGVFFTSAKQADHNKTLSLCYLYGDPASPKTTTNTISSSLHGMPSNGTVYSFAYHSSAEVKSQNNITENALTIFPNPAKSSININYENANTTNLKISLLDITGKEIEDIYEGISTGKTSLTYNSSSLQRGFYFVKCISNDGIVTKKIIVE